MPERAIYQQVADLLRLRIQGGEFVAGQRLPSEKDIGHEYDVSHATVGSAIALLRTEGLLEPAVPGRAAIVRAPIRMREVIHPLGTLVGARLASAADTRRMVDEQATTGDLLVVAERDGVEYLYRSDTTRIRFYDPALSGGAGRTAAQ